MEKRRLVEGVELPPVKERVKVVARELALLLKGPEKKQLKRAVEKAIRLAGKLEDVAPEKSLGVAWEKSAMLLALTVMAQQEGWKSDDILPIVKQMYRFKNEQKSEKLKRRPHYSEKFLAVRQLLLASGTEIESSPSQVVKVITDSDDDPQEKITRIAIADTIATLRSMVESGKYYEGGDENKPLIVLPITTAEARAQIKAGLQSLEHFQSLSFGAVAVTVTLSDGRRVHVPIVFSDTRESIVRHETNHRDFPGISLDTLLGSSLDEAITDILAEKTTGIKNPRVYQAEKHLFRELGKDTRRLLIRRYKDDSVHNSRDLVAQIVNELGFYGYVRLYQANPRNRTTREKLKASGAITTTEAQSDLKSRGSVWNRLKRLI